LEQELESAAMEMASEIVAEAEANIGNEGGDYISSDEEESQLDEGNLM
jgi:hypothetical protein